VALKDYRKDKKILWEEVKKVLFDYWLEICTNKELEFFDRLPALKIRILLHGAMYELNPDMEKFLRRVGQSVGM
jgi:hypothetical protein